MQDVIAMSTEQKNDGVGARVAEERKLAGWTQARLASEANVSTSLVKAVEQGRDPPRLPSSPPAGAR